jgi:hypothetical protein
MQPLDSSQVATRVNADALLRQEPDEEEYEEADKGDGEEDEDDEKDNRYSE